MNENIKELLIKFEGNKLKPYVCSGGKHTIGIGFNFDDNALPEDIQNYLITHGEITQEMSDRLLDDSIDDAELMLINYIFPALDWNNISTNRKHALISIMFNVGIGRFKGFKKMIAAIKTGDWEKAADESLDSKRAREDCPNRAKREAEMLRNG